mgnify:CR=1 FL=1
MLRPALRAIAAPVSRATLALAAVAALAACSTRNPYANDIWYYNPEPGSTLVPRVQSGPRNLAMFRGDTGMPLDWYGISAGIRWADIVIIGERPRVFRNKPLEALHGNRADRHHGTSGAQRLGCGDAETFKGRGAVE